MKVLKYVVFSLVCFMLLIYCLYLNYQLFEYRVGLSALSYHVKQLENKMGLMIFNSQLLKAEFDKIKTDYERQKDMLEITVTTTAYTPSVDETDSTPWITASGGRLRPWRTAAVSRSLEKMLPIGTIVMVAGTYWRIEDRMSYRWKDHRLDLAVPAKRDAYRWGNRDVTIKVVGYEPI